VSKKIEMADIKHIKVYNDSGNTIFEITGFSTDKGVCLRCYEGNASFDVYDLTVFCDMSESQVSFWAIIARIRTMADGSLRLILDLPEDATEQISILLEYKRLGVIADVIIKPRLENDREQPEKNKKFHI
jgi:hypothetical protein